ncbi:putative methyltransferase PMT3 [Abeliophyllum distichum]|uniref:Methyltransferase PMT3 n=1 Tax=Abeliophyllum distichum TaxID=126358 RepID=A0ABD1VU64_9LAMI
MEGDECTCGTYVLENCSESNQTVIWQKPLTNDYYLEREPGTHPPMSRSDDDPDVVWGVPMEENSGSSGDEWKRAEIEEEEGGKHGPLVWDGKGCGYVFVAIRR